MTVGSSSPVVVVEKPVRRFALSTEKLSGWVLFWIAGQKLDTDGESVLWFWPGAGYEAGPVQLPDQSTEQHH